MRFNLLVPILLLPIALTSCERKDHVDSPADRRKVSKQPTGQALSRSSDGPKVAVRQFETENANNELRRMLSKAWTLEDQRSFIEFINEKSSEAGETAPDYAAKLAMAQASDSDKMRSIATFIGAFKTVEDRGGFVFGIPVGKYRSKAVSAALGELENSQDLEKFYKSAPLGKDRNTIAAAAAARHLELEGAMASVDYIFSLEMPEEKFVAFCNLGEDLFRSISLLPLSTQDSLHDKLDSLPESLLPADRFSYRIRSHAYKEAANKSPDVKK